MNWTIKQQKNIFQSFPFNVEELHLESNQKPRSHPYYRLSCADWVNVLPITLDNQAILIEQPRVGPMNTVLETPGGVMDPGEKDPTMAAARELEEETGLFCMRFLPLGSINPNPAIMTNRCHFFLALGCTPHTNRKRFPDAEEEIKIVPTPIADLEGLVRLGRINSALGAFCILLAMKYLPS